MATRRHAAFYRAVVDVAAPRDGYAREESRTRRLTACERAEPRDTLPPGDPVAYAALVAWERASVGANDNSGPTEEERTTAQMEIIARLAG